MLSIAGVACTRMACYRSCTHYGWLSQHPKHRCVRNQPQLCLCRPFLLPTLVAGSVGVLAVICDILFMEETLPKLEGQSAMATAYHRIGGSAADVTVHDNGEANGNAHHNGKPDKAVVYIWAFLGEIKCALCMVVAKRNRDAHHDNELSCSL